MIPQSSFKLNPLSDRYRVCPNCKTAHMVVHRGRDFCSDKCADEYYNVQRRLVKQAEQTALPGPFENEEPLNNSPSIKFEIEPNLTILDTLEVHLEKGTYYHLQDLLDLGYDFSKYDGLYNLHNIPANYKCRYSQIGQYRIYRITETLMLIVKQ